MNTRSFPFARETSFPSVKVPTGLVRSQVPVDPLPAGVTSFMFVNSYPLWVRVVGTKQDAPFVPASEGVGWLLPPGFVGIFSTQSPQFMSGIAVARPGFPIADGNGNVLYPDAHVETFYGSGA